MGEGTDPIDDEFVAARIIPTLIAIRTELGCSIHAAIDEFARRYDRLRLERPDDFTLPPEQYGRGFYSDRGASTEHVYPTLQEVLRHTQTL